MALNPMLKSKAGASWEDKTNYAKPVINAIDPYSVTPANKNAGLIGGTPTVTPKPVDPISANIKANPNFKPVGATRVNEAITATTGNGATVNVDKPVTESAQDAFKRGQDETISKYEKTNQSNLDNWTATETARRNAEAEAIRAKVRQAIAQGTNEQNKIINDAPAKFVDPMNRASYQGMKNADMLKESLAKRGRYYSGDMDMAEMINNNETAGNINDLENSKAKVISDAQQAIANLQASGSLQEVQLVQEAAAKSLERLQAQQNLIEGRSNQKADLIFQTNNNALKTNYDIGANERQLGMQEQTMTQNQSNADRTFNTGVDQWNKTFDTSSDQWNKTFNQNQTNDDRTYGLQKGTADLNRMNTMAGLTGQIPVNELISQMSPAQIETYQNLGNQDGGYASAINATTDPVQKAIINEFRNQYLNKNPDNKYANTATPSGMVSTMQGRQVESGLQTDIVQRANMALDNMMKSIQLKNLPEKEQIGLQLLKYQLKNGELEVAANTLKNLALPEQIKVGLAKEWESIASSQANTQQGWSSIANQSGALKLNQDQFNAEKLAGKYDKQLNPPEKKSPYFTEVSSDIQNMYKANADSSGELQIPGSRLHKQFYESIRNSKLLPEEKQYLYQLYNIADIGG